MSETSTNSFRVCVTCDGQGFVRSGDFANRVFTKCVLCEGSGQVYLNLVKVHAKVVTRLPWPENS